MCTYDYKGREKIADLSIQKGLRYTSGHKRSKLMFSLNISYICNYNSKATVCQLLRIEFNL